MGKTKKQKKKARTLAHPYERPSAAAAPPKQGMATSEDEGEAVGVSTAADASLSVAAATASAGEAEQLQPSTGEGESEGGEESKGRLLQRHKAEWKKVRQQIDTLKRQRTKWKKKDFRQNEERKRVTKQLKDLEDEMRQRHEKELREWDARHSSGSTARTSTPTTVDSSGVDLAKLAASFGLPQPSGDDAMARE
jgi:exoribonuclease R